MEVKQWHLGTLLLAFLADNELDVVQHTFVTVAEVVDDDDWKGLYIVSHVVLLVIVKRTRLTIVACSQ